MNNQVDVHPEDLLDRERAGQLSLEQRKRLDLHTAACSPCAMIRGMSGSFANELAPRAGDEALLAQLCGLAAQEAGAVRAPIADQPVMTYARGRLRRRIGPFAMAAAVLLAGTAATASFWGVRQFFVHRAEAPAPVVAPVLEEPHRAARAAYPVERAMPAAPSIAAPEVQQPVPAPTHQPSHVRSAMREPAPPAHVNEEQTVDQLFASANEARRRGDLNGAVTLYQKVQQQYPGTREETTSRVLLGRLLLDRGEDIPGALSLFTRYLAESPNGTLAEEARLGKALSLMRLGRRTEERQAWQDLLAAHPNSVHAKRAEARLQELR